MLTALVLTLHPTTAATVPAFLGRAAHAWFLDQLHQADPALAQRLHTPNVPRPFTVSPLWCPSARPRRGSMPLSTGQPCFLRLTSLEKPLSTLLLGELAERWRGGKLHLTGVPFRIQQVASSPAGHPQARTIAYGALREEMARRPPPDHVTLRFLTPTTFRRSPPADAPFTDDPYDVPLPLPQVLFGGLLQLWNTFAPQPLPEALGAFARDCVVVSRYALHTELVAFGSGRRGRVGGFVGQCRFAMRCSDTAWRRRIGLLASFAPFAGVGWRTAMGLGQVMRVSG
jgi:CRISPR-associated endoribonuclease Cas6